MSEKKVKGKMEIIQRVEITCIFRKSGFSREFVTPDNKEAFNMLMNKLDRRGIKNQKGKLVFEFIVE